MIAIILLFVFQCTPIPKGWDFALDGQCVDVGKLIFGNAILNFLIDTSIIIAPLSLLWRFKIFESKIDCLRNAFDERFVILLESVFIAATDND